MLFNSLPFLALLAVTWTAWNLLGPRARRNLLLVVSYLFYAGWNPWFLPLLWFSTAIDYLVARGLERSQRHRRLLLACSLVGNLGVLVWFKYLPFLLASIGLQDWSAAQQTQGFHVYGNIPPGLSFYTFQTLSYTIDVYRGRSRACRSFRDFALYVAFFPQLLAGPILRSHEFLPQLRADRKPTSDEVVRGVELFMLGLFKKVVIADNIGLATDRIFEDIVSFDAPTIGLASLLFAIQVYCDFSGYSTMARGLGQLFGFRFPRNFDSPWLQGSPAGYRRAWHITIGKWFRDYVYRPLGGGRGPWWRSSANLLLLWGLFGLWHGASWTFVVWGLYNGLVALLWRAVQRSGLRMPEFRGQRWAGVGAIALFVMPSALFFRVSSVAEGFQALWRLVSWELDGRAALQGWWIALALLALAHVIAYLRYDENLLVKFSWPLRALILAGVALILVIFGAEERPFIYFQF